MTIPRTVTRKCKSCRQEGPHRTDGAVGGRKDLQAIICGNCGHVGATFIQAWDSRPETKLTVVEA